jgi:uncharacterized protein YkwD
MNHFRVGTRDPVRTLMSRHPKLRSIGIAAVVSAVLVLSLAPNTVLARPLGTSAIARTPRQQVAGDSWRLFKATNVSRGRFDVAALRLNRELSVIARRHSMAMARNGELFHTADADVYLHGIAWHTWGENVGYTSQDVGSMQEAFMDSPPHRGNILNQAFHQVAIGSVRVDGTLWVTAFFYG